MLKKIWFPVFILTVCFIVPLANGIWERLSFDAMLFPWIVGGTASILLLMEIVKEIREKQEENTGKEKGREALQKRKNFIEGIAWVFVILPMIYLIGILASIPIYLFAFLKWQGEKLSLCLILSASVSAFFYLVFVVALDIAFYEGILWPYING